MKIDLLASVKGIYRSEDPRSIVSCTQPELEITLEGVVGDNHYGYTMPANSRTPQYKRGTPIRNSRQVSIVSVEELDQISEHMRVPVVLPEWLGANLLIEGIPRFSFLPPNTRLIFPHNAVLIVMGENFPCDYPARVIQSNYPDQPGLAAQFPKQAMHLRGLVAWVEHTGRIFSGDEMQVSLPEQRVYSIR